MSEQVQFLVDVRADTAYLLVIGRAGYLNCKSVSKFFDKLFADGICRNLYVDLKNCTGMDSTFLGILTGAALKFKSEIPAGNMVLAAPGERNRELIENMGLDRILKIDDRPVVENFDALQSVDIGPVNSEQMLKAHENLVQADGANLKKFEDVITYLRRENEKKKG